MAIPEPCTPAKQPLDALAETPSTTLSGLARVLVTAGKLSSKAAEDLAKSALERKISFIAAVIASGAVSAVDLAHSLSATLALPLPASAQGSSVSLDQARAEHEAGKALLVDIREPEEHATGVAPGARLLPMRQLSVRLAELPRDRPVLLICNTQNRSRATFDALRERGWTNLRLVNGGMSEWNRRGWKTVKPGG